MANNPIFKSYLKFIDAKMINGKTYDDERSKYIGRSGLFCSVLSTKQAGKIHGKFYVIDDVGNIASISTSSGDVKDKNGFVIVKTAHSIYGFSKEYELTDEEEKRLFEYVENGGKVSEQKAAHNSQDSKEVQKKEEKPLPEIVFEPLEKEEVQKEASENVPAEVDNKANTADVQELSDDINEEPGEFTPDDDYFDEYEDEPQNIEYEKDASSNEDDEAGDFDDLMEYLDESDEF